MIFAACATIKVVVQQPVQPVFTGCYCIFLVGINENSLRFYRFVNRYCITRRVFLNSLLNENYVEHFGLKELKVKYHKTPLKKVIIHSILSEVLMEQCFIHTF